MVFSNSITNLPGQISFNNVNIERVKTTKFLGLHIDEKLNWKTHINQVCRTVSRNVGVMYKLKFVFPSNVLRMLYSTLVLPYLNYGVLAWGNAVKVQIKRILLLQKRAIRTVSNAEMRLTH